MSDSLRFIFWLDFLNYLHFALLNSLAENEGREVTLVCDTVLPAIRRGTGWKEADFGKIQPIIAPDHATMDRLLRDNNGPEVVHVFFGTSAYPTVWQALRRSLSGQALLGIYSEPAQSLGIKGLLRQLRGRWEARRLGRRIDFILPTGQLGVRWFRNCGYDDAKIYRFAYFLPAPSPTDTNIASHSDASFFDILFIGQLIHRKGIDLLLQALAAIPGQPWRLTLIGDGAERQRYQTLSERLGLRDRVRFMGALPNAEAMQHMLSHDLLVLPSRFDGWGLVVNEALARGVPVVASDMCGAADLLHNSDRGAVFHAGSVADLTATLESAIRQGKRTPERTERIQRWSRCLRGEAGAAYFLRIIASCQERTPKPIAPWEQDAPI